MWRTLSDFPSEASEGAAAEYRGDRNCGRVVSLAYVGADYPHSVQKAEHFEAPLRARAQLLSFIDGLDAGRRQ
jgi:hypothetical protein